MPKESTVEALFAHAAPALPMELETLIIREDPVDDFVYAVFDAAAAPGNSVAIAIIQSDGVDEIEAKRRFDESSANAPDDEPFAVCLMMRCRDLLGLMGEVVADEESLDSLVRAFATPVPPSHLRVFVCAAHGQTRTRHVRVTRWGSTPPDLN